MRTMVAFGEAAAGGVGSRHRILPNCGTWPRSGSWPSVASRRRTVV